MIDKLYASVENLVVEIFCGIACLVGVHRYAGCEEYGRNPVLYKDLLVGKTVEYVCEGLAAIVTRLMS